MDTARASLPRVSVSERNRTSDGTSRDGLRGLMALQRSAGNAATTALVSRPVIQRGINEDLAGPSSAVAPGTRVEIPPSKTLMTVNGQRILVPCKIYAIEDVPVSFDNHSMRSDSRMEFLPGDIPSRFREAIKSPDLTVGDVRGHSQRTGGTAHVALAQWDDAIHLVGADTVRTTAGEGHSGFVVTDTASAGLGRQLLTTRLRALSESGVRTMRVEVGSSARTLEFHRELVRVAKIDAPSLGQNDHYAIEPIHMARLLEAWDTTLTPAQRQTLKSMHESGAVDVEALRTAIQPGVEPASLTNSPKTQRAEAGAAVALAALAALSDWLNAKVEKEQFEEQVRPALEKADAEARDHMRQHPQDGVAVVVNYHQTSHPDTPITGPLLFGWVDVGFGHTPDEARVDIARQKSITPSLGAREHWVQNAQWIDPPESSAPTKYASPWPRSVMVRPKGGGTTLNLQDVKWDVDGFDDEGRTSVTFPSATDAVLHALVPPHMFSGDKIPVISRGAGGGSLQAIDFDPIVPGNACGVPLFPMTDSGLDVLSAATPIVFNVQPTTRSMNLAMTRFARPEDLEIVAKP